MKASTQRFLEMIPSLAQVGFLFLLVGAGMTVGAPAASFSITVDAGPLSGPHPEPNDARWEVQGWPSGFEPVRVFDLAPGVYRFRYLGAFVPSFEFSVDSAGHVDGDGIGNGMDLCVGTSLGLPVDSDGCSGAQFVELSCGATIFINHGQYVSCVVHAANEAWQTSLVTRSERKAIVKEAASSDLFQ